MFTSRAEYRLLLREDNADLRLTETGRALGLVDDARWAAFSAKRDAIERERRRLDGLWVRPGTPAAEQFARCCGESLGQEQRALDLIRRPNVRYADVTGLPGIGGSGESGQVTEQVEIQAKYHGYIERQQQEIERHRRQESRALPADLDYDRIRGISSEVREKLKATRPETVGQAARIPGVTPAAISLLLVYLKKQGHAARKSA
jgi:tRNA uridine 5-carboxymethylaminomethyl modification enzyme